MKKYLRIVVPVLIGIGLTIWLVLWMQKPSQGVISSTSSGKRTDSTFQDKTLDGIHITFQHSGRYVASSNTPANDDLERYTLSAGTNYDKRILASVVSLDGGRLESNGDYIYRQKSSSLYSSRTLQTSVGPAIIWARKDGTEQTAMITHGDKAVIISFTTSPGVGDDLMAEVNTVLGSLRWKQS